MTDVAGEAALLPTPGRTPRRLILILASLAFVVVAAAASLIIVQGVGSQMDDIRRTQESARLARDLIQALTDAETGQRGYLLTQDEFYLDPYRAAVTTIDETFNGIVAAVGDKPQQASRVQSLSELIEQKRAEMATTIQLAREGRLAEALSILRTDTGRTLMTEIGASLRDFIAEEDASLLARNDSVAGLRAWLSLAILAALAGAVVLTYALFTRTQRTVGSLYRSASELREQAAELERAVRDRTTELEQARSHAERERERVESLLQETNHRIGNSLATVSSLLGLQMSRTRSDEVRAALEAAQNRVQSIASGHRRLRLGADLETTQLDDFLHAAAEDMQNTFLDGRQVELVASVAPLIVQARDATTIGIIVGELVMNAAKHAFPGERSGRIELSLERGADDVVTLIVADDGEGYSTDGEERGLGTMIVRQLVAQFGGEARHESNTPAGTRVVITLPGLASKVPPVAAT